MIKNIKDTIPQTMTFKGPLDGAATIALRTLDTNPMANAVGIDMFSMVIPRTYVDTKRNKYAGAETFFREFTGTFIVCLSASYLAKLISKIANKVIEPDIDINTKSWFSKGSISFLKKVSDNNIDTKSYTKTVLENLSGQDGSKVNRLSEINWSNVDWIDEKRWNKLKWENSNLRGIHNRLKSKEDVVKILSQISEGKFSRKDSKNLIEILEVRITNVLGADKVTAEYQGQRVSSTLHNIIRDTADMGKIAYKNGIADKESASKTINKILKINKIKSAGALLIAASLGLANQYINRKITEKRTGTKGFVGDVNFNNSIKNKESNVDKSNLFLAKRIIVSLGMAGMVLLVMKVKSPKDFMKKLEFTGPVTSGNAIKTVYASTLIGRFMASDSDDELRETATRDYLGFLNWLVFGGFAAKGTANLLDRNRSKLFNTSKQGKGLYHWLNDVSLKSHNEIAAKGKSFANKNMWKINLAQASGLAYSTLALGFFLPKLNIWITNYKQKKAANRTTQNS